MDGPQVGAAARDEDGQLGAGRGRRRRRAIGGRGGAHGRGAAGAGRERASAHGLGVWPGRQGVGPAGRGGRHRAEAGHRAARRTRKEERANGRTDCVHRQTDEQTLSPLPLPGRVRRAPSRHATRNTHHMAHTTRPTRDVDLEASSASDGEEEARRDDAPDTAAGASGAPSGDDAAALAHEWEARRARFWNVRRWRESRGLVSVWACVPHPFQGRPGESRFWLAQPALPIIIILSPLPLHRTGRLPGGPGGRPRGRPPTGV